MDIAISNGLAYIASYNSNALEVIDVSNPEGGLIYRGSITNNPANGMYLHFPRAIAMNGNDVYVAAEGADGGGYDGNTTDGDDDAGVQIIRDIISIPQTITPTCASGGQWDDETDTCTISPECPNGGQLEDGRCVVPAIELPSPPPALVAPEDRSLPLKRTVFLNDKTMMQSAFKCFKILVRSKIPIRVGLNV